MANNIEEPLGEDRVTDTTNRTDYGSNGVVATARHEATKIGIDILKKGGNAFDAAVAVGFALGVCEPNASGIGGGGFMTAKVAKSDKHIFMDFREVAPKKARPEMWEQNEEGEIKDRQKEEGGKSICIPGEVAGWCTILEEYGTMTIEEVLEPSIKLATYGFKVSELALSDIVGNKEKFERFKEDGNIYLNNYNVGDKLINLPLANTLKTISKEGKDGFYKGKIAEQMVESINKWGGEVSMDDFSNFKVNQLEPVIGNYRGYQIISSPPPSSGGTHLIQILNILENFDLKEIKFGSDKHIHILSEIFKMAFQDRKEYMGDPNFVELPLDGLMSKDYSEKLSEKIDLSIAKEYRYDRPMDFEPASTTHFSIADKEGNLVSITKTISAFFGSGVIPKNTGIVLNCQMSGFAKGKNKSNSVTGGKKPLSSMTPTIVEKDNKPFAVIGSPGANRIITCVAQIVSNLIDFNMNIEEAVNAPRIHNDIDNMLLYEDRFDKEEILKLEKLGHNIKNLGKWSRVVGGVQGIKILPDGLIEGAADPRRDGNSIGY